eukprot:5109437-Alexandrium_andersonii.AAC.1
MSITSGQNEATDVSTVICHVMSVVATERGPAQHPLELDWDLRARSVQHARGLKPNAARNNCQL